MLGYRGKEAAINRDLADLLCWMTGGKTPDDLQ
jgi:hypothetical protein